MTKDEKYTQDNEFNNLKREFGNIKDSVQKITKSKISDFSRENIKEVAFQIVDELNDFLGEKKDDLNHLVKKGKENCEKRIKSNPFTTILGAALIGALAGIIIKK
jgi:ElaB/YqjD/DUF883 family membrane-anchored ribosome-binding protein